MNIWIINHYALAPSQGGLCRHYYFAKRLIEKGHKVRIFTSSAIHNTSINMIEPNDPDLFKEIEVEGLTYTYIKSGQYTGNGFGRIKNMLSFAFNIAKIRKSFGEEKPDLIYTSSPDIFTAYFAQRLAKKMKLPNVVEIRDLWPMSIVEYKNMSNSNPIIQVLYQLEKSIYKRADALVFTMPGGKDYITDKKWEKKISLDKVFHINNGVDVREQEAQIQEFVYEDADLADESTFKVLYVGSIRQVNDIGKILDVAKEIQSRGLDDIRFIIYGDGDQREALQQRVVDEGINNVAFKGFVQKKYVPYICSKANVNIINVVPTLISKYGVSWNKLFDYMAASKPILSTLKVNYDLIDRYDCGISTADQSVATIADAVVELYNMPQDRYNQMCDNAREGAKHYDFAVLTEKLQEAIEYAITHDKK